MPPPLSIPMSQLLPFVQRRRGGYERGRRQRRGIGRKDGRRKSKEGEEKWRRRWMIPPVNGHGVREKEKMIVALD